MRGLTDRECAFGTGRLTNSLFVMGIYLEAQLGNVFLSFIMLFLQLSVTGWCVIAASVQVFKDSGIVCENNRKDYFLKENKIKTNVF